MRKLPMSKGTDHTSIKVPAQSARTASGSSSAAGSSAGAGSSSTVGSSAGAGSLSTSGSSTAPSLAVLSLAAVGAASPAVSDDVSSSPHAAATRPKASRPAISFMIALCRLGIFPLLVSVYVPISGFSSVTSRKRGCGRDLGR
ncbi:MAG: hypothetical protein F4Y28_13105 [Acidimicrobiia bacterium]|nr:hypothetical protein [Acidimicrobiia bacterium]MYG59064.1 hypothetical protein [Acidimicrobiia bacterium]MYJ33198.1 hypothetical protein [Acidimicrobiia bacterium]